MQTGEEIIVGAVMPIVIDLVNKYINDSKIRYIISIVICLVIGVVFNLKSLSVADILASGGIIFATAQSIYKIYYSQSELRAKIYGEELVKRSA